MYRIEISNSTENELDIQFGYSKVTIIDTNTGESLSFRCCNPIDVIADVVKANADGFFKTKEIEGKLVRINTLKDFNFAY